MAGHNKWSQIKQKKGAADKKRGALFSKILKAISVAARDNPSADTNPRLRSLISDARENNIPKENIERAVGRAHEEKTLEEVIIEGYSSDGSAIIIQAITDNKNRTIPQIRQILEKHGGKMGSAGSARWAFEQSEGVWQAKFPQKTTEENRGKITNLLADLEDHDDVVGVSSNASL